MKCSLIIILLTSFQSIAFTGTAQDLISMRVNNKSFSQVLKTIEAKYSYRFVYSDSVALSRYKVNLDVKDASIEKVMSQLLDNTGFTYKKSTKTL
ncbi:STN domain-containing protein [Niabella defluvii]|nr:STN domain-containing protein [Niabella sp. I65]